jgi:tryptophan-rich sensory protein
MANLASTELQSSAPQEGPSQASQRTGLSFLRNILLAILLSAVALYGGSLPNDTQSQWFRSLARPDLLPREVERFIGLVWTTLFLLGGIGLAAIWNCSQSIRWKWGICGLLVLQLGLNYGYSYTFTILRDIPAAFWIAVGLAVVTVAVIATAAWKRVWITALCFLPYLLWVVFATEVTRRLAILNPITAG